LDLRYKMNKFTQMTNHVAKFHGDRLKELVDPVAKSVTNKQINK